MVLSNIKSRQQERGFTIVELLIVIVVIAILAGITIVAYAGITATAQQSKIAQTAQNVQSVAEAMNADNGYYPALANTGTTVCSTTAAPTTTCLTLGSATTKIPTGITIVPDAATTPITAASTPSTGAPTLAYACLTTCTSSTGGRIAYWDPKAPGVKQIYLGKATSAGPWTYPVN